MTTETATDGPAEPTLEPATVPGAEPEPTPAPEPELKPEPEPEPETAHETAAIEQPNEEPLTVAPAEDEPTAAMPAPEPASVKPKRHIRTRTLFTVALALGVVGGVTGGYTVQALRKPTPLPPLAVAQPAYPGSPVFDGTRPPALPAAQDDATIVDGDLTKLLLPTPAGATATVLDHSWMDLVSVSDTCDDAASCFSSYLSDGVVRIADTAWRRGDGLYVEIRIFQYRPGNTDYVDNKITSFGVTNHQKIKTPDSVASAGYEFVDSNDEYEDHAVAAHGDLAVYFWVASATQVPDPSIIDGLIQQQMARL